MQSVGIDGFVKVAWVFFARVDRRYGAGGPLPFNSVPNMKLGEIR